MLTVVYESIQRQAFWRKQIEALESGRFRGDSTTATGMTDCTQARIEYLKVWLAEEAALCEKVRTDLARSGNIQHAVWVEILQRLGLVFPSPPKPSSQRRQVVLRLR
jgi:hypothetical protein